ncbi:hypothetical protein AAG570_000342 [Ranatra chinensis]|uniref:Uncharacterized protein n=1 Tax=Ranatra chinensis TaxID=642074 RepID=A0ABD0YX41_9HEMI
MRSWRQTLEAGSKSETASRSYPQGPSGGAGEGPSIRGGATGCGWLGSSLFSSWLFDRADCEPKMVGGRRTLGLMALAISFTLATVSARKCPNGFYSCLKLDIHRALRKIEVSDNYTLLPGLGFERTGNFTEAPLEGQKVPALGDLIGQTEALFKSHALYWNFLPGVELRIAKAQPGDFNIGVRRSNHGGKQM